MMNDEVKEKGYKVMDGILMSLSTIASSACLTLGILESGENYYRLRLLEDNKGVCTLLIYFDTPIYNETLGREEGQIHLTITKVEAYTLHRGVRLTNELAKIFNGYDYISDINNYEGF